MNAVGLARAAYRAALGVRERASVLTSGGGDAPRLYYGGAPAGGYGGPRLKVRKLAQAFPEHPWTYNLVYLVSAGPFPSPDRLRRIQARGIPIVLNQNGVFYPGWYAGDWKARNRLMAGPYQAADHVLYQSAFCRESAERFLGPRAGPGEVLYNGVDTRHFAPCDRVREPGAPFTFLIAARVPAHQAYRLEAAVAGLAEARRHGLEARLVVAGVVDDTARAQAEAMARDLGIASALAFSGRYNQQGAPALFNAADAFVLTTHNDACPSAVIEAMACGLPVVYIRSGGVPELVGDEAGVGVATGESWDRPLLPDARELGAAMVRIAENRDALGQAARARAVARFDIGPWLRRHRELFTHFLGGRRGRT